MLATLAACVHVAPRPELPSRDWLAGLCAQSRMDNAARMSLLAGRPMDATLDAGPAVCACHLVGRNVITRALASGCGTVAQLGERTRAGTGCGSCVPELRRLLAEHAAGTNGP